MLIWVYITRVPRAPATLDPFSAIAEPRRRQILGALARAGGELRVNALVDTLGWPQPRVSKHLSVLRRVGLVSVRRRGRERMYQVNGAKIRAIHEWTLTFERFWERHLVRIKDRAEARSPGARAPAPRRPHPQDS